MICATAQIPKKLVRNLSVSEITSQIILSKEYLKDWKTSDKLIKTQVIMGQGESGYNLDNLKTYIEIAKNKNALDYGRTRITVSSVGLCNKKDELSVIEWIGRNVDTYLAISYIVQ